MFSFHCSEKDVLSTDHFHLRSNPLYNSICHNFTEDLFIDQGGFYPIAIHKRLLRAISPKIGNFARAIKGSCDHVCMSADVIVSDRSGKTIRPGVAQDWMLQTK